MTTKRKVPVKKNKEPQTENLVEQLKTQLEEVNEKVLRAQADYQNLVRRNQEERVAFVKFAHKDLVEALLQPLDHLEMAADQLQDSGLNMVVQQFKNVLNQFGVEEIECLGREFNVAEMEAVDGGDRLGEEKKMQTTGVVSKVQQKGYKLHGEIIRHAKVVI